MMHRGVSEAQRPAHSNGAARPRFVVNRDAAAGAITRTAVHARVQCDATSRTTAAPRTNSCKGSMERAVAAESDSDAESENESRAPLVAVEQRDDEMGRPQTGVS